MVRLLTFILLLTVLVTLVQCSATVVIRMLHYSYNETKANDANCANVSHYWNCTYEFIVCVKAAKINCRRTLTSWHDSSISPEEFDSYAKDGMSFGLEGILKSGLKPQTMSVLFWVKFTLGNTSLLVFRHDETVNANRFNFDSRKIRLKKKDAEIKFELNFLCETGFYGESCSYTCNRSAKECESTIRVRTTAVSSPRHHNSMWSKRRLASTVTSYRSESNSTNSKPKLETRKMTRKSSKSTLEPTNKSSSSLTVSSATTANEVSTISSTSRLQDTLGNHTDASSQLNDNHNEQPFSIATISIISTGAAVGVALIVSVVVLLVRKARRYAPTAADLSQSMSFIAPQLSATETSQQNAVYYEYDDGQSLLAGRIGENEYSTLSSKLSRWKRRRSTLVASVLTDAFPNNVTAPPDWITFNSSHAYSEDVSHVYHIYNEEQSSHGRLDETNDDRLRLSGTYAVYAGTEES